MIYSATITTDANTSEANAKETDVVVNKGLLWMIEFEFPAGCSGLVHAQIYDGLYQLFPATPGENMRGDGIFAKYEDLYFKNTAPFIFKIKTWNTDELYNHTIQVRFGFATTEAFMSRYMPSVTWDKFAEVLARTSEQQEAEKVALSEQLIESSKAIQFD